MRQSYKLVGVKTKAELEAEAATSGATIGGWRTALIVTGFVLSTLAAIAVGVSMYFGVSAWDHNKVQDTRLLTGEIRTTNLETNLDIETTNRIQEDAGLQAQVDDRIASLNQVHGDNSTHNVDLVVNGTGFTITADPDNHRVFLHNPSVLDINAVPPVEGVGTIFVEGAGMIDIMSMASTSTIVVNGSAIVSSLSNLQMQVSMQQIEIMELQSNATTTQMVIDALLESLTAGGGNETNITAIIMQLVADVVMAKADILTLQNITMDVFLPGMLVPWTGASGGPFPAGWLICDGNEFEQADYPELYAVVGTMYCPGPCSSVTRFAVPDMRGRIPVHKGGSLLNGAIATVVGAETHTLTSAQMPVHSHTGSTDAQGAHTHTINTYNNGAVCGSSGNANGITTQCGSVSSGAIGPIFNPFTGITDPSTNSAGSHAHNVNTNTAGSGGSHNNIQPSIVMQYLIKT